MFGEIFSGLNTSILKTMITSSDFLVVCLRRTMIDSLIPMRTKKRKMYFLNSNRIKVKGSKIPFNGLSHREV